MVLVTSAAFFLKMIEMHESFFQRSSEVSLIVYSLFLCESVEVKCLRTMRESIVGGKGGRMEARVDFFFVRVNTFFIGLWFAA